jgi:hypothetical protein
MLSLILPAIFIIDGILFGATSKDRASSAKRPSSIGLSGTNKPPCRLQFAKLFKPFRRRLMPFDQQGRGKEEQDPHVNTR